MNWKSSTLTFVSLSFFLALGFSSGCITYSFTGAATNATTMQVDLFFNNTDLGPANLGPAFTNSLKDYYQRNSSLNIVEENGELQIEGVLTDYRLTPVAPVSSGSGTQLDAAALTRLTIAVRVNYVDNIEVKNSFKDKTFSFYADFPNTQELTAVQEDLEKKIFEQILLDIFNATVANW
jgi:Lipopolysaccharide-assembly